MVFQMLLCCIWLCKGMHINFCTPFVSMSQCDFFEKHSVAMSLCTCVVTGHLADKKELAVSQVMDWSTRGRVNSPKCLV